ncbi:MAG: hypothetical protein JWR38_5924 [Mucilaginibacter sp.]|nr:hypothetical protein [Mucilaginibacter sp.]
MKNFIFLFCSATITLLLISCNDASNIEKTDICGKEFTESIKDPMYSNVSTTYTTVLNCDGTFTSGNKTDLVDSSAVHQAEFHTNSLYFTGKWEVIKNIPDNVKQAVITYGLKEDDHNYSIIKYSSSNGVSGYCLYHLVNSTGSISPLNTGQVSQYDWGNVAGSPGIFDGFLKE